MKLYFQMIEGNLKSPRFHGLYFINNHQHWLCKTFIHLLTPSYPLWGIKIWQITGRRRSGLRWFFLWNALPPNQLLSWLNCNMPQITVYLPNMTLSITPGSSHTRSKWFLSLLVFPSQVCVNDGASLLCLFLMPVLVFLHLESIYIGDFV